MRLTAPLPCCPPALPFPTRLRCMQRLDKWGYLSLGLVAAVPCVLLPPLLQPASERAKPWHQRYWVRANLWIAIFSFIGGAAAPPFPPFSSAAHLPNHRNPADAFAIASPPCAGHRQLVPPCLATAARPRCVALRSPEGCPPPRSSVVGRWCTATGAGFPVGAALPGGPSRPCAPACCSFSPSFFSQGTTFGPTTFTACWAPPTPSPPTTSTRHVAARVRWRAAGRRAAGPAALRGGTPSAACGLPGSFQALQTLQKLQTLHGRPCTADPASLAPVFSPTQVPITLYLMTHAYFCLYHALANLVIRRARAAAARHGSAAQVRGGSGGERRLAGRHVRQRANLVAARVRLACAAARWISAWACQGAACLPHEFPSV